MRFLRFGLGSLDVEVFAYVLAGDFNQFLEIQEETLLRIIDCVESSGVLFALPSQILTLPSASDRVAERALLKIPMTESNPVTR